MATPKSIITFSKAFWLCEIKGFFIYPLKVYNQGSLFRIFVIPNLMLGAFMALISLIFIWVCVFAVSKGRYTAFLDKLIDNTHFLII